MLVGYRHDSEGDRFGYARGVFRIFAVLLQVGGTNGGRTYKKKGCLLEQAGSACLVGYASCHVELQKVRLVAIAVVCQGETSTAPSREKEKHVKGGPPRPTAQCYIYINKKIHS